MTGKSENGGWEHKEWTVNEEAEHCPICLGAVGRGNLAMPDSCCHIFCLNCILTWAESQRVPSCPVDRRSFSVIYKWDTTLGCVLVPVKRKMSTLDPEGPSSCFLSIPYEGQMTQRTHAKTKDHVNKCKKEDLSVINNTKIRQTLHFTWSLSPFGMAVDSLIQGISEPLLVAEEESQITGHKQCRHQTQNCPWLLAAIPASGLGNSRHRFDAALWRNSRFDFRSVSSFSSSGTHSGFSNFVFQGRGCVVTCPKGGEKNGGQTSGSKAPAQQTESVTSRRSNRNSKAQEEAPTPEATSSQSHSSDSDLSGIRSPQLCKPSPADRNGKQTASRKSDGKKKGPDGRNSTSRVCNSLTASEEDEEAEEEKQRKEKEEGNFESENSDAEATQLQWNQSSTLVNDKSSPNPSLSNAGHVQDEVRSQSDKDRGFSKEQEQVVKEAEGGEIFSPPSKTSVTSPGMSCDGSPGEYHTDSGSSEDMEDIQQINLSSHSRKLVQDKQEDGTNVMKFSEDLKNKASEVVPSTTREQGSSGESQCCDYQVDSKIPKAQCPSEDKTFECETKNVSIYSSQNWASKFSKTSIEEDNQSKDDIDTVLMDFGLSNNEHNNNLTINPQKESSPAGLPATTSPGMPKNSDGSQREREGSSEKESLDRRNGRERQSRFHSATTTWSPKRESSSWGCLRDQVASPSLSHPSCVRSWERNKDSKRDSPKKERSRERKSRKRSRSRSRSRSHSSSRSRTWLYRRGASPEQLTLEAQSPSRRTVHVSGTGDKNLNGNGSFADIFSDPGCSNNPDWVLEKTRSYADAKSHESGSEGEDKRSGGLSDSLTRRGTHMGYSGSERSQTTGRGGYRNYSQMGEQEKNRWQPRNTFSGTANNSGTDAYSQCSENRGGRRKETDHCELPLDRSGWSSASSWAVRRTLPADVQSYYSRRERGASGGGGGGGSWSRQEDDQPTAPDPTKDELTVKAHSETPISLGGMRPLQYSLGQYVPPVGLQPRAPYGMLPQVPIHLHPTVPLLQVPAVTAQALPPPPPPPPPMLHGSLTADQPDSRTTQKLQIQERAINEVKIAIKPYYQKKDITKEEYKQIVRKAVEKVCHSKSGEVNSGKVANLVKAYVNKYKHTRKK